MGKQRDRPPRLVERALGRSGEVLDLDSLGTGHEQTRLGGDERQLLRDAVVKLPGDPPPLVECGDLGHASLVARDLADCTSE